MGYIYRADMYCDVCGDAICAAIRAEGKAPEDELETRSYDSDDFPKPYDDRHEESDTPDHCGQCRVFLHNPLTSDGYRYVQNMLNETGIIRLAKLSDTLRECAGWYDFVYWTEEDCEDDSRHTEPGWYSSESY